jgi:hypothetical protein
MADLRVTGAATPAALQPAQPSEAVRAAQRAFFTAAMKDAAPTQSAPPVQAPNVVRAPTVQAAKPAAEGETARYVRPGSLLDIKV